MLLNTVLPRFCRAFELRIPLAFGQGAESRHSLRVGLREAGSFPRISIVLDLDRFDGVAEHLFLSFTVGSSEPVMLPLVFRPRVDFEALQVGVRRFCIHLDSAAYRAIAAANTLVVVDLMEKLGSFRRINHIFHGDEDRPLVGVRFLDHDRFNPVIPDAEIQLSIRQSEPGPEQQACSRSNTTDPPGTSIQNSHRCPPPTWSQAGAKRGHVHNSRTGARDISGDIPPGIRR